MFNIINGTLIGHKLNNRLVVNALFMITLSTAVAYHQITDINNQLTLTYSNQTYNLKIKNTCHSIITLLGDRIYIIIRR